MGSEHRRHSTGSRRLHIQCRPLIAAQHGMKINHASMLNISSPSEDKPFHHWRGELDFYANPQRLR
ncbi:uncharacterized protein MYCFIDRAFT_175208 [Pseudocercospora fijiensis CIRAD86]|uniref:Uncharacterized protein n=1 Tax=Pseudocercospora fijiensis (strain CIRAD86) TaxID=383855 RepID=M2YV63_PSEFD|nr:uncharacterized protein MYCFIDRAFT_175208 [Pseudocercospora fijiensis CIRAD86]EME81615.1 hypothetical protein MYCFIDRAFT_175208 [Pseudocercospora fijiensis CIRAD86]